MSDEAIASDISARELLAKMEAKASAAIAAVAFLRSELKLPPWDGAVQGGSNGGDGSRDGGNGQIRSDEFFRMSIPDGIVKYLSIVKKPQPPRAIVDGLQRGGMLSNAKNFASNVWTAINRLKDSGLVVNTSNGWGLVEWYPGKPPKPPAETPKAPKKKSPPTDQKATSKPGPKKGQESQYSVFMKERRAAGRSLPEANKDWKNFKEKGAY